VIHWIFLNQNEKSFYVTIYAGHAEFSDALKLIEGIA
jgi:hypothetical protein